MDTRQVQSQVGVTLVGGGNPTRETIEEALKFAPCLMAADGGANHAIAASRIPSAIIGDLDSLDDETRQQLTATRIVHVTEQDTTDFEKCLRHIDAPYLIGCGFSSGRLDHTLAVFSALVRDEGPPTAILGDEDVVFSPGRSCRLALDVGTRVSLFPLASVAGRSNGLRWDIEGLQFDPLKKIGTSNEALGAIEVTFDGPGMLIIVPRSALKAVLNSIAG